MRTAALFVWIALPLLPSVALAEQSTAPKRVLVLHWYNKDAPWNVAFDQGFKTALQSARAQTVEYYTEYLETNRFPGEYQSLLLRDYLRQKYADLTIDMVVANSDTSLDFLLKYRDSLFPRTPIIFVAARRPGGEELAAGPGLTGIVNINTHRRTLDLALELHPGTEQVFVISGTLEHDKKFETLAREELQGYESRVQINYLTDLQPGELIVKMKGLPRRSIVLYVWQQSQNEQGEILETRVIFDLIAPSAPVPIYGMIEIHVGNGLVGGYVTTPETIGARAAKIALQVANGARAQDIPVASAPSVPIFDWRELRRWDIDEERLPPGSILRFKELSFWQQYKGRIIGVLALIAFQTALIAVLLVERRKRRRSTQWLRESEGRYRDLLENANDIIYMHDLSGNFTSLNKVGETISGYTREEARRMNLAQVVAPEYLDLARRMIESKISTNDATTYKLEVVAKDGRRVALEVSTRLIYEDGRPIEVQGIARDITERKLAEVSLQKALAELQRLKDQVEAENIYLQEQIMVAHDFGEIIGRSNALKRVLRQAEQVAPLDTTVLIMGETGTGKELLAHATHDLSARKARPLVKVNCATLPSHLIESELFGHEKGAFTGAHQRRVGRFEIANGGTIFLDEIGELPLDLQAKLLRVLQEGEFEHLGSSRTVKVDVRVIAATNRDLEEAARKGLFRSDLYYRLSIFPITVPPLRERKEDIPMLVMPFVNQLRMRLGKEIETISQETMEALQNYPWPGNIRELRNVIERAAIITQGTKLRLLDSLESRPALREAQQEPQHAEPAHADTLEESQRRLIIQTLEKTYWRVEGPDGAAALLGLHPNTLRSRMKRLGIGKPKFKQMH
jgi:PAS domain S-box-containing protein